MTLPVDVPRTRILPGQSYPDHLVTIYNYLEGHLAKNQRHASSREMVAAGFASSTSVLHYYYGKMVTLGMLEKDFGVSRGLRLIPRKQWKERATAAPKVFIQKPPKQEITENA